MTKRQDEAAVIAATLRDRLPPGEPLYIWGYAHDVYWQTGCRPAARYLTPYYIDGRFSDAEAVAAEPNAPFWQAARANLIEDLKRVRPRIILHIKGDMGDLPYAAFGDLRVETGLLTVAIAKVPRRQSEEELLGWIRDSAALIERYFGRFPADGALLLVLPARGHQIHGRCRGTGGASILFTLGTEVDLAEARRSWELVHEMVHLGFPSLARRHIWVEEGLATYVEPIARARVGELSAGKVWGDLVRGLPQGLPRQGDEGLWLARCSGCSPTWRSGSAPAIASGSSTRFAPWSGRGEASPSAGRSRARSKSGTARWERRCSRSCTRGWGRRPPRSISALSFAGSGSRCGARRSSSTISRRLRPSAAPSSDQ